MKPACWIDSPSARPAGQEESRSPQYNWLYRAFAVYARRYVCRHFDAVRVQGMEHTVIPDDASLVICMNHASWWDPLSAMILTAHAFPRRVFSAPMDTVALERYGIFRKLGCFFGVEQGTGRGARQFLRGARAVLAEPGTGLCLTPQGRFADVRERPARLAAGLAHLLATQPGPMVVLPLAIEYTFWNERTPGVFARFGPAISPAIRERVPWGEALEAGLTAAQDVLAAEVISRDEARFSIVLSGAAGPGGVYGIWQRMAAWVCGEEHDPRHPPRH